MWLKTYLICSKSKYSLFMCNMMIINICWRLLIKLSNHVVFGSEGIFFVIHDNMCDYLFPYLAVPCWLHFPKPVLAKFAHYMLCECCFNVV